MPRLRKGKRGGEGLGDQLYDGAASFGRFMAYIWFGIFSLIALVFFILGIVFLFGKNKYIATDGKITSITSPQCKENPNGKCNSVVEYRVNNNTYKTNLYTPYNSYEGQTIKIEYDSSDPHRAQLKGMHPKVLALIFFGIAILLFGIGYLIYYINTRYKFAAAASGVGTGFDMIT